MVDIYIYNIYILYYIYPLKMDLQWIYPLKMVIFHSYVTVYQRVSLILW